MYNAKDAGKNAQSSRAEVDHVNHHPEFFIASKALSSRPRVVHAIHDISSTAVSSWDLKLFILSTTLSSL